MLQSFPYNYEACQWSEEHFDATYSAKWVPDHLPTLILAGDEDMISPVKLFAEERAFQRSNILYQGISRAGHFPWIENPDEVAMAFTRFFRKLNE